LMDVCIYAVSRVFTGDTRAPRAHQHRRGRGHRHTGPAQGNPPPPKKKNPPANNS